MSPGRLSAFFFVLGALTLAAPLGLLALKSPKSDKCLEIDLIAGADAVMIAEGNIPGRKTAFGQSLELVVHAKIENIRR
jgi:hypothetical protein